MKRLSFSCFALLLCASGLCASAIPQDARSQSRGTTLFVVRHAEAYQNLVPPPQVPEEKRDALTPKGRQQARKTGEYLKGRNIGTVIASPFGRTRQTARIISQEVGLKGVFLEDPHFRSMKKGKGTDGAPVTWDWREAQWNAGRDPRPSEGESLQDATARAVKGVEALLEKYPGKNIVIVTHSDICAGLAGHAAMTPFPQRYKRHEPGLGAVIEIQIGPQGKWKLK